MPAACAYPPTLYELRRASRRAEDFRRSHPFCVFRGTSDWFAFDVPPGGERRQSRFLTWQSRGLW
jgi:hypothetical protein